MHPIYSQPTILVVLPVAVLNYFYSWGAIGRITSSEYLDISLTLKPSYNVGCQILGLQMGINQKLQKMENELVALLQCVPWLWCIWNHVYVLANSHSSMSAWIGGVQLHCLAQFGKRMIN